jgi:hypothetical protein
VCGVCAVRLVCSLRRERSVGSGVRKAGAECFGAGPTSNSAQCGSSRRTVAQHGRGMVQKVDVMPNWWCGLLCEFDGGCLQLDLLLVSRGAPDVLPLT